jgi:hypothetical protein
MKSFIIWDITPCSLQKLNRRFGRKYLLHFLGFCLPLAFTLVSSSGYPSTLKIKSICSSETSVGFQRSAWSYTPENRTHRSHLCENLRFYACGSYSIVWKKFLNSWYPNVHSCVHISHWNLFWIMLIQFISSQLSALNVQINIELPSSPASAKKPFPLTFSDNNFVSHLPTHAYILPTWTSFI